MKQFKKSLIVIGGTLGLLSISANAEFKLVEEKQCLQCHDIKVDKAGPSFQKIAAKWKGKKDAEATLMATTRKGSKAGGGLHWTTKAEMPDDQERPLVNESEARQIVQWMMKQ